ncbi:MAG TPA: PEP-CTERM sorting domain-containing protein [Phycisphaerae bacterium]|nr:PEP-CTERM sorting domain-containing protein [Phycisphaerae bacterium]
MFKAYACAFAAIVLAGALPQRADASAQLIVDGRSVAYQVSVSDAGGSLNPTGSMTPANPQDMFVGAAISNTVTTSAESASASGLASQTSGFETNGRGGTAFTFDSFVATGRSIGEARGQVSGDSASGSAETLASLDFSIDAPHDFSITGTLSEDGQSVGGSASASSEAVVELLRFSSGNPIVAGVSGSGPVALGGLLEPGTYRLVFRATSDANVTGDGSATSNTSFQNMSFDLTEVPEPATGMILLAGAVLVLRRNQRVGSEFSRS